jgi:FMNH2-dependent dimethyl sulfone monooxygenase
VGTPEQVSTRLDEFAAVGVDLVLLQSSPQFEEMERFSAQVLQPTGTVKPV